MTILNETLQWLKVPHNRNKALHGLLALNLLAGSALLFITANECGPLYEALKPTVVEKQYTLQKQYIGDIEDDGKVYRNVLIFNVITPSDQKEMLYFAGEHIKRSDINDGDEIIVTWSTQFNGETRAVSVVCVDMYNQIDCGLIIFS